MTTARCGGCACGQVRYELGSEPFDTGYCHCSICRRTSGAPVIVFTTVPLADFVVTAGADLIRTFPSTSFGWRQFCSLCGTQLAIHVTHEPDTIDVTVASLDDPDAIAPGFHIFFADRIAWFDTSDELPRHASKRSSCA
jgi:hypothetical protein